MQVADRPASAAKRSDATLLARVRQPPSARPIDVVLRPLFRPELGEIRIEDAVFAIGRAEPPFASYGHGLANVLSRQHARIFRKDGFVYVVDLQSRNGTTVNRAEIGTAPCQLRDGDEICFAGALSYRVQIGPRGRPEAGVTLTLTPERVDSGLQPIVITTFPFLVGKTETNFSHYKSHAEHGRELGYLSRRQACIYLKEGQIHIEDLGSGNGTFVDGRRLPQAVLLHEGAVVAFGGTHFVYRVSITQEPPPQMASEPVESGGRDSQEAERKKAEAAEPSKPQAPASGRPQVPDAGKTQFMAAPTSFLDVFCPPEEPKPAVASGGDPTPPAPEEPAPQRRRRGRASSLLAELASLHAAAASERSPRTGWKIAGVTGILGAVIVGAYFWTAPDRELKNAVARGEYARAAVLAGDMLDKHPDDLDLKARATELALKASVPAWLAKIQARDFEGATGVLAGLSGLGRRDSDLRPFMDELTWLGNIERLVSSRGGPQTPIRIYADEDRIGRLIGRWNDDSGDDQRALARIASYVPPFATWYGEALTHLRRLQSESAVYLPVIEHLKANITTELARDDPDALTSVLKETEEKYPGLGGLDSVRQDLSRYVEIRQEARTRKSGRLFALLRNAQFATPPFQQSFRALVESGQLPTPDLLRQYGEATQAWKDGNTNDAFAGLQKMAEGPWGEEAAAELQRRQGVTSRFEALQQSRNADGFVDQLLAFRESLDADEDVYFLRTTASDLNEQKDQVIEHAQNAMNQARTLWEKYRSNGAIDASQRIETSISDQFRTGARLLAEASRYARQGFLMYSQIDPAGAAQWTGIRDEIESEAREQRSRLHDLDNVVEPELLKAKLALLGDATE
jgi:pSer/pThr/pTyr-binding forkhead associated (FHA) protein